MAQLRRNRSICDSSELPQQGQGSEDAHGPKPPNLARKIREGVCSGVGPAGECDHMDRSKQVVFLQAEAISDPGTLQWSEVETAAG